MERALPYLMTGAPQVGNDACGAILVRQLYHFYAGVFWNTQVSFEPFKQFYPYPLPDEEGFTQNIF